MRLNLKLSHKGLILVSIPLIFELFFVASLAVMLSQAEHEIRTEAHIREIITQCNVLSKSFMDIGTTLLNFSHTYDRAFLKRCQDAVRILPTTLDRLNELTSDTPQLAQHVTILKQLSTRVVRISKAYEEEVTANPDFHVEANKFNYQVTTAYGPFMEEVKKLADEARTLQTSTSSGERERRARFEEALIAIVIASVFITIFLALFFSKGVSGRLAILIENANRLAKKEKLVNPVSGSDEVAQLDRVFHSLAEALDLSEQRRQEFISMICHDLRAPLSSVQTTLSLAERGSYGEVSEKGKERFGLAERNIETLVRLINELLDIQKIEAGMMQLDRELGPVSTFIDQAVQSVRTTAETKGVVIEVADSSLQAYADSERLVRVMTNLLANAIRHSPRNGKITVGVTKVPGFVKMSVADEGPGVPDEYTELIFDKFRRIDERAAGDGTGLGLAICKSIVEAHGGLIGVSAVEPHGALFWFQIPSEKSVG